MHNCYFCNRPTIEADEREYSWEVCSWLHLSCLERRLSVMRDHPEDYYDPTVIVIAQELNEDGYDFDVDSIDTDLESTETSVVSEWEETIKLAYEDIPEEE